MNEGTLGNWVRIERIERGDREGLTVDERADLAELRSENARLRIKRDLLSGRADRWLGR